MRPKGTKNSTPKCYFVHGVEEETGIAVVALTGKQAIKYVRDAYAIPDVDFIDHRVKLVRDADIKGLVLGTIIYDTIEGLRRGAYSLAEDEECPHCHRETVIQGDCAGNVGCYDCLEAIYAREDAAAKAVQI